MIRDLIATGATVEVIAGYRKARRAAAANKRTVPIWQENALAARVFFAMHTQWQTGMAGATGLNYSALPIVMQMLQVPPDEQPETFTKIQIMEDAALSHWEAERQRATKS